MRNVIFSVSGIPITQGEPKEVLLWAMHVAKGGDSNPANNSTAPSAFDDELMEGLFVKHFDWLSAPASLRSKHAPSSNPSSKAKGKESQRMSVVPIDDENILPIDVRIDPQSLEVSVNPEIVRYIAGRDVIGHPLFTQAMKSRNKKEKGYIGVEIERRCGGQNDGLPHADLVSEYGVYEIKGNSNSMGSMSMFDKSPSDSYVKGEQQGDISPNIMRNRRICELFGGPSKKHPGMISYASPNAPTYLGQTSKAGQTLRVDADGVYITYDYSADQRVPHPFDYEEFSRILGTRTHQV